jgi:biofilm protein TabA
MAIFGAFSTVRDQVRQDGRFSAALTYVEEILLAGSIAQRRILAAEASPTAVRIDLDGGAFGLEQVYAPKARPDGFFESHRKYIDVQVIVAGEELMEVEDLARLTASQDYNPDRDFLKYADTASASVLKLRAGDVAIFFPEDGHMPGLRWGSGDLVRKTVVKVPVTRE